MTMITLRSQTNPPAEPGDVELPGRIGWRRSADRRLIRAAESGDLQEFGAGLREYTALGRKVRSGDRLSDVCDVFLQPLWSLRAFEGPNTQPQLPALLKLFAGSPAKPDRKTASRISHRLLELLDNVPTGDPLSQLSLLTILAWGGSCLSDEALTRLWLRAFQEVRAGESVDADPADPALTEDQSLLMHGEIPFLAGLVFQEVRGSKRLLQEGERQLRAGLEAGTDTDGMPHSRLLARFSLWLSPLCRAAITGRRFDTTWWNTAAARRYLHLVQRAAAMTRSSGQFALGNGVALAPASLLKAAASVPDFENSRHSQSFVAAVANDVRALTQSKPQATRRTNRMKSRSARWSRLNVGREKRGDRPASQSDWAQLACLRNNWGLGADACVIAYDDAKPRIDLTGLGTTVISGNWNLRTSIDEVPVSTEGDWECVCWFSDRDVDYLELQRQDNQVTVLRQAALSRTDHFLYLADSVRSHSDSTRGIEHAFELPLANGAEAARDALTREWLLQIGPLKVRVLPVSLEQDATIASAGNLAIADKSIRFQQSGAGPALMSALFLDWSPARRKAGALWRSLTVAEDGRIVGPTEAAGIHLRLGKHQWLFYRSFTPGETARTVLGQHTDDETILGEMNSNGDLNPLVTVEAGTSSD